MANVDWKAVERRLDYVETQIRETREMVGAAERGEYSPLMDYDRFQEIAEAAVKKMGATRSQFCMMEAPHRCSRCEWLVRNFMAAEAKAA